VGPVYNGL